MGLKCITTFKLDSTRSVARKTELFQLAEAQNSSDDIQKSVSVRSETVDAVPVITAGLSTDCPRKENGKKQLIFVVTINCYMYCMN